MNRPLNTRQLRFCEFIVAGMSGTDAWLAAGYQVTREVARTNAAESLANPRIKAHIATLRKPQTEEALMIKDEKLAYLAKCWRTPIGEIRPDSDLCTEYSEDIIAGGRRGKLRRGKAPSGNEIEDETVIRRRIKGPDKLRAIELHSKLAGDFAPEKIEHDAGPNIIADIKARAERVASILDRNRHAAAPAAQVPAAPTGNGAGNGHSAASGAPAGPVGALSR